MHLFLLLLILATTSSFADEVCTSNDEASKLAEHVLFRPEFCRAYNSCDVLERKRSSDCDVALEDYMSVKNWLDYKEVGTCGMTAEEIVTLKGYTAGHYGCMNRYLRKPLGDAPQKQILVDVLNSALKKIPPYKGLVRRGVDLPPEAKVQHSKGSTVTYDAFTSTSVGDAFSSKSDQLLIFSSTGRPIMGFSSFDREAEILFPAHTKFRILEVTQKAGKNYYIMKEVTDASEKEQAAADKQILENVAKVKNSEAILDRFACPVRGDVPKEIIQQTQLKNIEDFKK